MPPAPVFFIWIIVVDWWDEFRKKPPSRRIRGDLSISHSGCLAEEIPARKECEVVDDSFPASGKLESAECAWTWFFEIVDCEEHSGHEECHGPLVHEEEGQVHECVDDCSHAHCDWNGEGEHGEDEETADELDGDGVDWWVVDEPVGEDVGFCGGLERDGEFVEPGFEFEPEGFLGCGPGEFGGEAEGKMEGEDEAETYAYDGEVEADGAADYAGKEGAVDGLVVLVSFARFAEVAEG